MRHLSLTLAGGFGALLAITGCSANYDNTGYVTRPDAMSQLKPGVVTREDVQRLLGTPSSVAAFDDKTWYYIGEKTEQVAFWEPTVLERHVLAVKFDESGVLTDVESHDLKDGKPVQPVVRETPTAGQELTFFEQLLGNLGRYNASPGLGSAGSRRGPGL